MSNLLICCFGRGSKEFLPLHLFLLKEGGNIKKYNVAIAIMIMMTMAHAVAFSETGENYRRFLPHKRIYMATRVDDGDNTLGQVKLQSGFKFEIKDHSGLFFAYSIKSLMDIQESSEPFRDVNHNPEVFFEFQNTDIPFLKKDGAFLRVGYEHESNGVNNSSIGPNGRRFRSRTTHNVNIQPVFIFYRNFWFSPKIWWNFQKKGNEDIEDFYGNTDLSFEYLLDEFFFTTKIRGNPAKGRGRIEFDVSYPMAGTNLFWFAQYFNGYGETLLDYNRHSKTYRFGIMLSRD